MQYLPFELHCHTQHSDGTFTVPQLLESVAAYGYTGMALTDHNAVTGYLEITEELQKRTCLAIPGIEWTTFFGHMLVLGGNRFVDWRFVTPDTIDEALAEIQSIGGVVGVAHPCEVGSPLMCGCNWEFRVTRWDLVNYVEVWSEPDPHTRAKNILALPWYDNLLNQGHHLALSAGRDWHGPDKPGKVPLLTATYLGIDGAPSISSALDALRAGRTYVTLGPTLDIQLHQGGACFGLGDTVHAGEAELTVQIAETERRELWSRHQIHIDRVRLTANGAPLQEVPYTGEPVTFREILSPGWLRVELLGSYTGASEQRLAITSPIYADI